MDTFALRAVKNSSLNASGLPSAAGKPTSSPPPLIPHLDAYRSYVTDQRNIGTFVSTSANEVTTAPKTFYGHTVSFLTGKTNAQEVATLHQSIVGELGPHIANYAFPRIEREQAATSQWGGYIQQSFNTALTTALNPTLQNISLDVSIPQDSETPSPALPFYQRQLRPILQSAVQELNPTLRGIKLDASLPTNIPSVGVSHQLVQQVISRVDSLITDATYIKEAAMASEAIIDRLQYLEDNFVPSLQELSMLNENISGLAEDIANHQPNASQARLAISSELSLLLKNATTDIPQTIQNTQRLITETKALASMLQQLKEHHNYDELGSSSPIKLEAYNFEQFLQPVTELFQEETILATNVIRHLCSPPSSVNKASTLATYLKQNARIAGDLKKYSEQISKLKQTFTKELNTLANSSQQRIDANNDIIHDPSLSTIVRRPIREMILRHTLEEDNESAQEDLAFTTRTLHLLKEAEKEIANQLVWKNIPDADETLLLDKIEAIPLAQAKLLAVDKKNQG